MTKALVLMLALLALPACNTVAGVGQDITGGAQTVRGWFN
ncbi:MAG: entericidin [Pararhodobacter sp.]